MADSIVEKLLPAIFDGIEFLFKRRVGRIVLILMAFLTSISLGAWYGHTHSPRYLSREAAVIFLTNHFGLKSADTKGDVVLTLHAGLYRYEYSLVTNTVTKSVNDQGELIGKALPDQWSDEEMEKYRTFGEEVLAPVVAGAAAETTLGRNLIAAQREISTMGPLERLTFGDRVLTYVAFGIVGATGGYLGYKLTYDSKEHLSDEIVVRTIMDPDSWRNLAHLMRACTFDQSNRKAVAQFLGEGAPPSSEESKKAERICEQVLAVAAVNR